MARRSGFTPATLRYYEEIGLLPPPSRTASGYRSYGDDALDRLAFIARAKQLGCALEEIRDLSIAWDGGRCGPIQDRLRELVASKRADAQVREHGAGDGAPLSYNRQRRRSKATDRRGLRR